MNNNEMMIIRRLEAIIVRQNAMLDIMSNFIEMYAKQNGLAIERFEQEESEYTDAT